MMTEYFKCQLVAIAIGHTLCHMYNSFLQSCNIFKHLLGRYVQYQFINIIDLLCITCIHLTTVHSLRC